MFIFNLGSVRTRFLAACFSQFYLSVSSGIDTVDWCALNTDANGVPGSCLFFKSLRKFTKSLLVLASIDVN